MSVIANTGSIATYAYNRIDSVPSTISGTAMAQYAETAVYQLENWTKTSIGTTSIDQKYVPFLTEMTVAMTLARMHGVGVDFNYALGDFKVDRGSASSSEALQVDIALKTAQRELIAIGRPHKVYATFYG